MATKNNTQPVVETAPSASVQALDVKRQKLVTNYKAEAKVPVSISPFYAPYLGSTAMISVNGIAVYVPCNGRPYNIPASFAGVLYETIAQIDAAQRKAERMSNVKNNIEGAIGELQF